MYGTCRMINKYILMNNQWDSSFYFVAKGKSKIKEGWWGREIEKERKEREKEGRKEREERKEGRQAHKMQYYTYEFTDYLFNFFNISLLLRYFLLFCFSHSFLLKVKIRIFFFSFSGKPTSVDRVLIWTEFTFYSFQIDT